jgi:hypothetical protein
MGYGCSLFLIDLPKGSVWTDLFFSTRNATAEDISLREISGKAQYPGHPSHHTSCEGMVRLKYFFFSESFFHESNATLFLFAHVARFGVPSFLLMALFNDDSLNHSGCADMLRVKDTLRSTVNLSFDGRVFKVYHGPKARERFENEVRVLRHLEARGCDFVPRLLEADAEKIRITTTNCGSRVEHLDAVRKRELFAELEKFGVRHDDPEMSNVTYRQSDGRFCVVDFEFATILPDTGRDTK